MNKSEQNLEAVRERERANIGIGVVWRNTEHVLKLSKI